MKKKLTESEVYFDGITHTYLTPQGDELIGVTSLMSKHNLSPDYSGIPADILARAAERGTKVHKALEDYDNGEDVIITPLIESYRALQLKVLASEYLVSDNTLVASMIDKVLEDFSLVDVKTTSELHISALEWQLSIYAYLFERQNPGCKVPGLYALHVKNGKCKPLREINRIPDEEIERLFECERKGEIFFQKEQDNRLLELWTPEEIANVQNLEMQVTEFETMAKQAKEMLEQYRERLYGFMMANNIDNIKTDHYTYSLRRPHERTSLDTKRLSEEMPEVAAKYMRTSLIKGTVQYKQKL